MPYDACRFLTLPFETYEILTLCSTRAFFGSHHILIRSMVPVVTMVLSHIKLDRKAPFHIEFHRNQYLRVEVCGDVRHLSLYL